jgi:carbamate kinase
VAAIGSLADIEDIVNGAAGTQISTTEEGIRFR